METPSRPSFHAKLDSSFSRIGQALAGGNLASISRAVFVCEGLWDAVIRKVTATLDAKFIQLSKRNTHPPYLFRHVPIDALRWCDCIAELKVKAPLTLQLVIVETSRNVEMHIILESAWLLPLC